VKDTCGVQFEKPQQEVAEKTILLRQRGWLMERAGPSDPAARAAADVQRLLAQAPHLRRIVAVAEAAAAGEDPNTAGPEPSGGPRHPVDENDQT
jgi:hypothetical protein